MAVDFIAEKYKKRRTQKNPEQIFPKCIIIIITQCIYAFNTHQNKSVWVKTHKSILHARTIPSLPTPDPPTPPISKYQHCTSRARRPPEFPSNHGCHRHQPPLKSISVPFSGFNEGVEPDRVLQQQQSAGLFAARTRAPVGVCALQWLGRRHGRFGCVRRSVYVRCCYGLLCTGQGHVARMQV